MKELQIKATLLGVGPVSELVIHATMDVAAEEGFPPMFIASRNQVNMDEFGGGYLLGGMNQEHFAPMIRKAAEAAGYEVPLFICRDHGGPWQRNTELENSYSIEQAMEIARISFRRDIEVGFNYLHIDPTKCPLEHTPDDLITWTVELIEYCEQVRSEINGIPIDYEIGTEDIKGGQTSSEHFRIFIEKTITELEARCLPRPVCVVGQTGTLTRLNRNDGGLNAPAARKLAAIALQEGIGFKEHNCDYIDTMSLAIHPDIGISGANVAPEFGYIETASLFELCGHEEKAVVAGSLRAEDVSGFDTIVSQKVRSLAPWRRWLPNAMKDAAEENLFSDRRTADTISKVCGHYVFSDPEVLSARGKLMSNIKEIWGTGDAESFVLHRIRESIRRYVIHFNITGLNALIPM